MPEASRKDREKRSGFDSCRGAPVPHIFLNIDDDKDDAYEKVHKEDKDEEDKHEDDKDEDEFEDGKG